MRKFLLSLGLISLLAVSGTAQTTSYQLFDTNETSEFNNWIVTSENASISNNSIVFDDSGVKIVTQQFNVETHDTLTVNAVNLSGTLEAEVETFKNGTETNKTFTVSSGSNTFDVSNLSADKTRIKFTGSNLNGSIESFGYTGTLPQNAITGAVTGSATGFIDSIVSSISNVLNSIINGILEVFGL